MHSAIPNAPWVQEPHTDTVLVCAELVTMFAQLYSVTPYNTADQIYQFFFVSEFAKISTSPTHVVERHPPEQGAHHCPCPFSFSGPETLVLMYDCTVSFAEGSDGMFSD